MKIWFYFVNVKGAVSTTAFMLDNCPLLLLSRVSDSDELRVVFFFFYFILIP